MTTKALGSIPLSYFEAYTTGYTNEPSYDFLVQYPKKGYWAGWTIRSYVPL